MTEDEKLNLNLSEKLLKLVLNEKVPFNKKKAIADHLIEIGADVNAKIRGRTLVRFAKELKQDEMVEFLVSKGGKDEGLDEGDIKKLNVELLNAINDEKRIQKLVQEGADIDAQNNSGWTALMNATWWGDENCVKTILENRANVNIKNNKGGEALSLISFRTSKNIVQWLLDKGADINAKDNKGMDAFLNASLNVNIEVMQLLLKNGADINSKDKRGRTALMNAVYNCKGDVIDVLLKNKVDVNAKDDRGVTALMIASEICYGKAVELLLDNGVDVNAKNKNGETAYDIAKKNKNLGILKIFNERRKNSENNVAKKLKKIFDNVFGD